jgi:hypothetical protein
MRMKAQLVLSPACKAAPKANRKGIRVVEPKAGFKVELKVEPKAGLKKENPRDRSMHLLKNRSLLPTRTRAAMAKPVAALAQPAGSFGLLPRMSCCRV